jgi:hypothetical protein
MDPNQRVWIVIASFILVLAIIACSSGSIIPTPAAGSIPTLQPSPISKPSPTSEPSPVPLPTDTTQQPMQGLAGRWSDPDTCDSSGTSCTVTTIIARDGGYAVKSVINPGRGGNELTTTNWSNGVLTWTYCVPDAGNCITSMTVSLEGDSLYTTFSDDRDNSGQTVFQRLP